MNTSAATPRVAGPAALDRFLRDLDPAQIGLIVGADARTVETVTRFSPLGPPPVMGVHLPLSAGAQSRAALIGLILDRLAGVLMAMWPHWYGGFDLARFDGSAVGQEALRLELMRLAGRHPAISAAWARRAAAGLRVKRGLRRPELSPQVELAQLAAAIDPNGPVLCASVPGWAGRDAGLLITVLEWAARCARMRVALLAPEPPPDPNAADRLPRRLDFAPDADAIPDPFLSPLAPPPPAPPLRAATPDTPPILAVASFPSDAEPMAFFPVVGRPHPLSAVEQRLAVALAADRELGPLFAFNRPVVTCRNNRFIVDLLWDEGRLAVEIDGYGDHALRSKFNADRQRDYELLISGYRVLRIANDEIFADPAQALEKIRDVVRLGIP